MHVILKLDTTAATAYISKKAPFGLSEWAEQQNICLTGSKADLRSQVFFDRQ